MRSVNKWIQNNRAKWNEYMRKRSKRIYDERKAAGLCARCGEEPICKERSVRYCEACLNAKQQDMAVLHAERRAAGKCISCGKRKPYKEFANCRKCLEAAREKNLRWRIKTGRKVV